MKKVLSFVLVLSMILGSFGMAFAAPADVVGTDYEDAVNALTELGVIAGYKDGSFRPENVVTRAEAATFVIKAMGLEDYAVGKSAFADMAGHWADPYVAYAASLGFVKGNTDGTFAPNAPVTSDQMITMLVQALGYKAEYLVGGYPGAFVNQAKALGMLDNVKAGSEGCSRGDVAQLIYNTLDVPFVRYDKEGSLEDVKIGGRFDTMMARLSILGEWESIVIDEDDVELAAINVAPYVGAYVDAYVNDDHDIIAIKEVKSTFLTGELDLTDDVIVVDDVTYTLTAAAKTDITSCTSDAAVAVTSQGSVVALSFVNGEKADVTPATDKTYTFGVAVSGKTIKAVYSVTEWNVDDHGYFSNIDADDIKEDAELFGFDFYKNDDQEIDLNRFEIVGAKSLEDIKEDSVVYVYVGASNKITRIAVGTDSVEGTVSKVNSKTTKFTVNGKVYEEAAQKGADYVKAEAGDVVVLTLDAYGDIYDAEIVSGQKNYAVVVDVADGDTSLNGKPALVKLFLADGTVKTYEIAKDIKGFTTAPATTIDIDEAVLTAGAVVKFSLDKDGVIDAVATTAAVTTTKGISAKGTFNGKTILQNAVIVNFDGTSGAAVSAKSDSDKYALGAYATLLDTDSVDATYVTTADGREIEFIMLYDFATVEKVYGLFNGWAYVDGDYDYKVTVMVDGNAKDYDATTAGKTVAASASTSTGALYELVFDASGAVKGANLVNNNATDKIATIGSVAYTTTTAVDGKYLVTDADTASEAVYTLSEKVIVYKWDADNGAWAVGRTRDLHNTTGGAIINMYSINGEDDAIFDIVTIRK